MNIAPPVPEAPTPPPPSPSPGARPEQQTRLGAASGQLVAWAALGVLNAIMIAFTVPFDPHHIKLRALHHFYDAGQILAVGLLSAAAVEAYCRLAPRARPGASRWGAFLLGPFLDIAALSVIALAIAYPILHDDLAHFAVRLKGDEGGSSSPL